VSNLLNSLLSSAGVLRAYDRVLEVSQNNVANASTPGYVRQRQTLAALPFDPSAGLTGGVRAGEVQNARDEYADRVVRRQESLLGKAQQDVDSLTTLQTVFDISGNSGIPKALNDLFGSFSAWGQSPTDAIARQTVLDRAADAANAFQQTAASLVDASQQAETAAGETVNAINSLTRRLQTLNVIMQQGAQSDAGLDAQIHSTLEELSTYVNLTAITQGDGSVTVLLNGETPLVVGNEQYALSTQLARTDSAAYPEARGSLRLIASDGSDVTDKTTQGQLGSLLDLRNRLLPSFAGDADQMGDLNRMAIQLADRINQILTSGNIADGDPPTPGVRLFTYGSDPTNAARTLALDTTVTAGSLAAIQPGPPYVANGIPLALAALATPQDASDRIDGASFAQFYGRLAGRAGSALEDARAELSVQQSAVTQAKDLRKQMSGVSLDEEAAILIEFQRAYEANSRFISVLDKMSEDLINILRA
jgi:flagellar hook-associated protein 1 FlgK